MDIQPNIPPSHWTQKYKPETGRCFSYTAPKHLHEARITTITAYLNHPIELILHHPGQFCTWNVFTFKTPQKETYVDVYHEVIFALNPGVLDQSFFLG